MDIPEDFLHFIWKYRLFDQYQLTTVSGQALRVVRVGDHNKHAGPDFENALISIGETLWAGCVEIHVFSSDWLRHGHQYDAAYNNVVLHVVGRDDDAVIREDGSAMPVLELADRIPEDIFTRYKAMLECLDWIPCEKNLSQADMVQVAHWINRVAVERLERRAKEVTELLAEVRGDWEDAFYIWLARNFGFRVNALPFELLARTVSRTLVARCRDRPLAVEALYFGQAGLLDASCDEFSARLAKEYLFLCRKYGLQPHNRFVWKFMRMRPSNFPTLRIAQFSALMCGFERLFSLLIGPEESAEIKAFLDQLKLSPYWKTHYRFGVETTPFSARPGNDTISNLMINSFSVFLLAYGRFRGSDAQVLKAIRMLEALKPETNSVIQRFIECGLKPASALESQGLLELKKYYCDAKKCLSCGIGMKILS